MDAYSYNQNLVEKKMVGGTRGRQQKDTLMTPKRQPRSLRAWDLVLGCIKVSSSILLVSLKFHPLSHGSWGWSARLNP